MKIKSQSKDEPRIMTWDDSFNFRCYQEIDCFNACCRDITIFLNPLDVGPLARKLGLDSTIFLARYTVRLVSEATGIPAVALKMSDDEQKRCPFVTKEGCSVYEARPYSCRLYPLDTDEHVEYRFIVGPDFCHGLKEKREQTVEDWRREQGLHPYDEMDHQLGDVMHAEKIWEAPIKNPKMQDMLYMVLYDPSRFRDFIFESSFLQKFKVDDDILEMIREDDTALLYFGAQWLRFALFGKKGFLKIDKEFLERKKKEVLSARMPK